MPMAFRVRFPIVWTCCIPAHEIPEAEYGDEMIIVGRDGDAEITMDEMARLRGTINYEVACGFGMRLDKVYV